MDIQFERRGLVLSRLAGEDGGHQQTELYLERA